MSALILHLNPYRPESTIDQIISENVAMWKTRAARWRNHAETQRNKAEKKGKTAHPNARWQIGEEAEEIAAIYDKIASLVELRKCWTAFTGGSESIGDARRILDSMGRKPYPVPVPDSVPTQEARRP